MLADPADWASRYVRPLVVEGASTYVENANIEMRALVVDGRVMPLVINRGLERCGCDVCSAYAHYVEYSLEEFGKRHPRLPSRLPRHLAFRLSALRIGRIDRVVYINNWLFATNPSHGLSGAQIRAVTDHMTRTYPGFAIVFRSVNPRTDQRGARALQENNFRFVRSRRVYILDTTDGRHLEHKNAARDLALLDRTSYEIIENHALEPHAERRPGCIATSTWRSTHA